jgi:hypothetical protein
VEKKLESGQFAIAAIILSYVQVDTRYYCTP